MTTAEEQTIIRRAVEEVSWMCERAREAVEVGDWEQATFTLGEGSATLDLTNERLTGLRSDSERLADDAGTR